MVQTAGMNPFMTKLNPGDQLLNLSLSAKIKEPLLKSTPLVLQPIGRAMKKSTIRPKLQTIENVWSLDTKPDAKQVMAMCDTTHAAYTPTQGTNQGDRVGVSNQVREEHSDSLWSIEICPVEQTTRGWQTATKLCHADCNKQNKRGRNCPSPNQRDGSSGKTLSQHTGNRWEQSHNTESHTKNLERGKFTLQFLFVADLCEQLVVRLRQLGVNNLGPLHIAVPAVGDGNIVGFVGVHFGAQKPGWLFEIV
ncbi:hypothetical protein OGAPHI_002608 [Ogataea philodendri]|uniref:Uncharacterized protein n=1 Tax=Ogataea philodendri TaxID=1378263 RepID=A0A9P8T774_9ASCO|nr:uncharacterized protein OGAPHI_002608 [Ogataea philodendri]KAH3668853.1 hypothetical protein OGAPHI_002608 [Ogataea philodendri]